MLIRKPSDIPSSEITSQESYDQYFSRRRFLRSAAAGAAVLGAGRLADRIRHPHTQAPWPIPSCRPCQSPLSTTGEQLTSLQDITHYNNYYEFGVDKDRAREKCRRSAHAPVDREGRRQGQTAEDIRYRRAAQAAPARRPRLSPSLR